MPYTPENQKTYPQPESQKEGVGFPIARLVAIISLSCGAVIDVAIGPYKGKETGEHALLRRYWAAYPQVILYWEIATIVRIS